MNRTFVNLLIFCFSCLLFSCEKTEKIENFPMSPSKLVLNCQLNPDSVIQLLLFKSLSVLDNATNKNITNAKVELYRDDILIASLPAANKQYMYVFDGIKPEINHTYKVVASASGYETVWAEVALPEAVFPDKVTTTVIDTFYWYEYYMNDTIYNATGKVTVTFTDPAKASNYYALEVYSFYTYYQTNENGDTVQSVTTKVGLNSYNNTTNSPLIDYTLGYGYYFTDKFFNGSQVTLDIPVRYSGNTRSTTVYVELISVSETQYFYDKSKMIFSNNNGNPFTEPVQIYTNIHNGFGIFSAINGNVQSIKFN